MAYHRISRLLAPKKGFSKTARLPQVVLRMSDIRAGLPDSMDRGENLLVDFALSQLVNAINNEQWDIADDVIACFPRSCCASSDALFDKLIELRHKFEKTPGKELILEDLDLQRTLDEGADFSEHIVNAQEL